MTLISKIAGAALLGLFFASPVQASQIEPGKLKAMFPGSFQAVVAGYNVSFVAHGDGSLVGKYQSQTDTGAWSVQSGQLCIMLSSWLNGRTSCAKVVQHSDGWYRADQVLFRKL